MISLMGAILGAAMGSGAFACVLGWRGVPTKSNLPPSSLLAGLPRPTAGQTLRAAAAMVGSAIAIAVTGWLVAGLIAGIGVFAAPTILGAKAQRDREMDRMTALATWIEMVRDTISAAPGLIETLKATAVSAPTAIRAPVRQLAARAEREPLLDALSKFASEVDHAIADTVAVNLGLAAANQAGSLQESLAEIAENIRQEVSMRLRIETSRARQFTSARFIAGIVTVFAIGMAAFSKSYLEPFDTLSGQMALAVIGALFIASGVALMKMSRFASPLRILDAGQLPAASTAAGGLQP